jgi:hypothetical protein
MRPRLRLLTTQIAAKITTQKSTDPADAPIMIGNLKNIITHRVNAFITHIRRTSEAIIFGLQVISCERRIIATRLRYGGSRDGSGGNISMVESATLLKKEMFNTIICITNSETQ